MKLIGYSSDDLITPEVKKKQFAGARCCYCDIKLTRENFSREHVVPKSRGGRNKKSNKLPSCKVVIQWRDRVVMRYAGQHVELLRLPTKIV